MQDALDGASRLGLRTLALSEDAGGAGADTLTCCIVVEELAAGDVDVAMVLARTALLAPVLFDQAMTPAQRKRFLPPFVDDERSHLALAGRDYDAGVGWTYHRPAAAENGVEPAAVKQGNDWVVNGVYPAVANAPVAKLFAVQARTDPKKTGSNGISTFLVARDAAGLTVRDAGKVFGGVCANGEPARRWHHGAASEVVLKDCRVSGDQLLSGEGGAVGNGAVAARNAILTAAVNIGIGRAAYEAAVDYAKLRRQGGRNIIGHQAIGTKLADCAIKLELARTMVWKAAWAADHPDAVSGRSVSELPLSTIARVYTAEAMQDVTLLAAECFGAMGVMRDMPLQKYVHDAMVFLHAEDADDATKLTIAEAVAGYQRPLAA
jgi:alkylation response protein AidB-like acyl-CoA dehydrogenase